MVLALTWYHTIMIDREYLKGLLPKNFTLNPYKLPNYHPLLLIIFQIRNASYGCLVAVPFVVSGDTEILHPLKFYVDTKFELHSFLFKTPATFVFSEERLWTQGKEITHVTITSGSDKLKGVFETDAGMNYHSFLHSWDSWYRPILESHDLGLYRFLFTGTDRAFRPEQSTISVTVGFLGTLAPVSSKYVLSNGLSDMGSFAMLSEIEIPTLPALPPLTNDQMQSSLLRKAAREPPISRKNKKIKQVSFNATKRVLHYHVDSLGTRKVKER